MLLQLLAGLYFILTILNFGTAVCNPCTVDSAFRLCFHVAEAHRMNDNMQKCPEMLWICSTLLILNGKHENTNPVVLYCWRSVPVITTDKVVAISVPWTRLWRSLLWVPRALCPGALYSCGTQLAAAGTDPPQHLLPICTTTEPWLPLNAKHLGQQNFKSSNTPTFQADNKVVGFNSLLCFIMNSGANCYCVNTCLVLLHEL